MFGTVCVCVCLSVWMWACVNEGVQTLALAKMKSFLWLLSFSFSKTMPSLFCTRWDLISWRTETDKIDKDRRQRVRDKEGERGKERKQGQGVECKGSKQFKVEQGERWHGTDNTRSLKDFQATIRCDYKLSVFTVSEPHTDTIKTGMFKTYSHNTVIIKEFTVNNK